MGVADWLIVIIPVALVMGLGIYSRNYVHGVADFLSAGRCAGRYVLSMGDMASALAITGLISYIEVHYKTGFAIAFWGKFLAPLYIAMSLYGYCTYRFRETRAMSLGQFLEMRYNRKFRIFASLLRSVSEMLANMIMPAIAARFFIYFLDLPHRIQVFGITVPTFFIVILICLVLAITLICCGGTLSMLIADSVQGMVLFPLMVIFVLFILYKFSWSQEIIPVMSDRAAGESFLNSFDVKNARDFNLLMVFLSVFTAIMHRASWIGAGYTTAAKSPHEQKMAGVIGSWRGALNSLFYVLIALGIITVMNHKNFSGIARDIKVNLSRHIAIELVAPANQQDFMERIRAIPEIRHQIGRDAPLSNLKNLDTPYMEAAHQAFKDYEGDAKGNFKFQQYMTLYYQLMMASGMRRLLPPVIMGLFCLLMILAMISTDDTRIFSASMTFTQDVLLPFFKNPPSPEQHIRMLRIVSIGVGVLYCLGSLMMAQLDYIRLFVTVMTMMWMGGCGPVMIFGLYSRFGNTCGAFASLISGMVLALGSIILQRNWADYIYPFLTARGWADPVGRWLERISAPLNPYVVWKMDPVKFPINSYEIYLMAMLFTLAVYCGFSLLTQKEPFNLDRMLHRGIYSDGGEVKVQEKMTVKKIIGKLVGITPEYSRSDRFLAWISFWFSFVFEFLICFLLVLVWNLFSPWPVKWWGTYFFIITLLIPGIIAFISTFWFGIGGAVDLFRLFRDLEKREADILDNGQVEGHVSLADRARFEKLESETGKKKSH